MAGIFRTLDVMQDAHNIDFIQVGATNLQNGYLVVADTTVGTYVSGNGDLYNPAFPTANTDANLAIVCAEEYYQDADGHRINVNDPTKLIFTSGQRVRVIRPVVNKKYWMSNDLITGTPVAGQYLIPTANAGGWTFSATIPANVKFALKIEELNVADTFVGLGAITGTRVRCVRALGE